MSDRQLKKAIKDLASILNGVPSEVENAAAQKTMDKLVKLLQDHSDRLSNGESHVSKSGTKRKRSTQDEKVNLRIERISVLSKERTLDIEDLVRLVTLAPMLHGEVAEHCALARILRGVQPHTADEWAESFSTLALTDMVALHGYVTTMTKLMEEGDEFSRQYSRHNLIEQAGQQSEIFRWIFGILQNIENIKFASEWVKPGEGRNEWRVKFFRLAFQDRHKEIFEELESHEKAQKMYELTGEFAEFKANWESTIAARNQLLDVFILFGASILMDPFWNMNNLGKHRTTNFRTLFTTFSTEMPRNGSDIRLQALNQNNKQSFHRILRIVAGSDVAAYVVNFLEDK
ncbi:hypothetical protein Hypma_000477 [Hypsizygus marmoreus]|uniref:Uncharacterized protein n=1 Tax=Hypsizygus marmoreus TaxID=39966 RepID=A0A369J853_HYPMA|nr:hypothetical protein Hypma_000477 [Hypsizygus marmoreus]